MSNQVYYPVDHAVEETVVPTGGLPFSHGENSDTHRIALANFMNSFLLPSLFSSLNFRSDCVLCRVLLYLLLSVTQLIQTQYISGVKSKSRVTSIMSDS